MATALLFAAPAIVLDGAFPRPAAGENAHGLDKTSDHLIDVIKACLWGDDAAMSTAHSLVTEFSDTAAVVSAQTIAAEDFFHRSLEQTRDPRLADFVVAAEQRRFEIPPLLESLVDQFKVPALSPMADADVLACRHLMGSTIAELKTIRKALPGLTFAEVLGKPYSANRLAVIAAKNHGIQINDASCDMPPLAARDFGSYASIHRVSARAAVERYVQDNPSRAGRPLLVIDDGGALIDAVGQAVTNGQIRQPVVAIEQTTHGLYAVQGFAKTPSARRHGFACISVARSEAKLRKESLLIARSVLETIESWLLLLGRPLRNVGIVGFGAVGAAVAKAMTSRGITVRIHDKNPNKLALAEMLGGFDIDWTLPDLLQRSEIIIGASGGTSIDTAAAEYLRDDTILISASSGDLEFSGLRHWSTRLHPIIPDDAAPTPFDLAHGMIEATSRHGDTGTRRAFVANRGFPVNFDGRCDPIPVRDIQLTRALIVGAVLQAAGAVDGTSLSGMTGVFELHRDVDQFVTEKYSKITER
ncbi:NAD(P)-binding domain-containing protein [Actinoplanes sp. NPDC020271]|uniref:NAD(P)-binding domain-containing protein n=1 Tax=Actinoplanes sp. NPDC020271 TaxID=3363896 RepID=UPI0037AEDF54